MHWYPDAPLVPWMFFDVLPHGFWVEKDTHRWHNLKGVEWDRNYFDWLGKQLGYKEMEDWYTVQQDDIFNLGGRGLLKKYYAGSPSRAIQAVYPHHQWTSSKFNNFFYTLQRQTSDEWSTLLTPLVSSVVIQVEKIPENSLSMNLDSCMVVLLVTYWGWSGEEQT